MSNEDKKKYRDALELSTKEFAKRSLAKILDLSGAEPYGETALKIRYGGTLYQIQYPEGEISLHEAPGSESNIDITDRILLLQYLTEVCGVPISGKWISYRELPGGNYHYGTFNSEALEPLAKRFGAAPADFELACQKLGGEKLDMGDLAFSLPALPKLQLAIILWLADDEFPAKASILFDANASSHLNTEALEVLGINITEKLIAVVN